ncbi:hypothetical protein COCNU_04G012500 [Cocos nucifera]|uniref:PB1 domain-containing protein n=1 Tax=Cocos nucifera TaxID=13894 RepID=A0A8K0N173_COCNU|nr:hypothetical protein COCNU_04G012500 [Cocos nucifera]
MPPPAKHELKLWSGLVTSLELGAEILLLLSKNSGVPTKEISLSSSLVSSMQLGPPTRPEPSISSASRKEQSTKIVGSFSLEWESLKYLAKAGGKHMVLAALLTAEFVPELSFLEQLHNMEKVLFLSLRVCSRSYCDLRGIAVFTWRRYTKKQTLFWKKRALYLRMARRKILAICQSGGEFVTHSDGSMSYSGGEAHAIDIDHEMMLHDLKSEISGMFNCDADSFSIKYFLPNNKRTLITVSNDKDLKRMVDFHADSDTTDVYVLKKVENRIIRSVVADSGTPTDATTAIEATHEDAKRQRLCASWDGVENIFLPKKIGL